MINRILNKFRNTISKDISTPDNVYRLIAVDDVDDSYLNTGEVNVKIQLVGTSKIFSRPIKELYQKSWLEAFSREDVALIAALYTAEHTKNFELIKRFPKRNSTVKASVVIVGILFSAFLILSNLSAFKLASIGNLFFPAGLIFFPITYIFDNILTEVYGFKVSRRVIWAALFANLIVFIGMWSATYLNPAPFWHDQKIFEVVYRSAPRIFIASMFGYLAGEFINSTILAKLKVLSSGRYLWLRALTSTVVGVFVDTVLFTHIAFLYSISYLDIWKIILTMYWVKVIYETCAIPITYKVSNYLKRKDNVDHYDFQTKFNPFSLAV